jgi:hypothetical protein
VLSVCGWVGVWVWVLGVDRYTYVCVCLWEGGVLVGRFVGVGWGACATACVCARAPDLINGAID